MATVRCDYATVLSRLVSAVGAGVSSTFGVTLDDPRRSSGELIADLHGADDEVCELICQSEGHGFRPLFLSDTADMAHSGKLPDRIGPITQICIKHVSTDIDYRGAKVDKNLTLADIERWRANVDGIYGPDHDAAGSSIAGYCLVLGDEIYFTGYRARGRVATFTRTDGTLQSPKVYEDGVLAIAVSNAIKRGDNPPFASEWRQTANMYRQTITAGRTTIPALEIAQAA